MRSQGILCRYYRPSRAPNRRKQRGEQSKPRTVIGVGSVTGTLHEQDRMGGPAEFCVCFVRRNLCWSHVSRGIQLSISLPLRARKNSPHHHREGFLRQSDFCTHYVAAARVFHQGVGIQRRRFEPERNPPGGSGQVHCGRSGQRTFVEVLDDLVPGADCFLFACPRPPAGGLHGIDQLFLVHLVFECIESRGQQRDCFIYHHHRLIHTYTHANFWHLEKKTIERDHNHHCYMW